MMRHHKERCRTEMRVADAPIARDSVIFLESFSSGWSNGLKLWLSNLKLVH